MTTEQNKQFSDLLEILGQKLDVTETEFKIITGSYEAVGNFLSNDNSALAPYKPQIHPQGSFLLGTVIRPVSDEDDIDIDLVCELQNKPSCWTQYHLKQAVGNRLKESDTYKSMLDEEGKRCWTLLYAQNKYHMDVLPSLVDAGYRETVKRVFSDISTGNVDSLAFRITDRTLTNYRIACDPSLWLKSNPFGFAKWFLHLATEPYKVEKVVAMREAVNPVPKFRKEKFALQRVVQLLKRHRDIMFNGDDDKPISIIITTLAARCYNEEKDLFKALSHIAESLTSKIETRNGVKWIPNPVNPSENFADKWQIEPQKEQKFYQWANKLETDIRRLSYCVGQGLPAIQQILEQMFGERTSRDVFREYAASFSNKRNNGTLRTVAGTGLLGSIGSVANAAHNFYGVDEK